MQVIPRSLSRNGWTLWHLPGAVVMVGLGAAATAGMWADMWRTAVENREAANFVLVPLAFASLIWVRWERWRLCEPVKNWTGPLVIGGAWLLSLVGQGADVKIFVHLAALLIVTGCLLSVIGWDPLRKFAAAFGVLLLIIPVPWTIREQLTMPLTAFVAELSLVLYHLMGLTVERHGPLLHFANVTVPALAMCGAGALKAIFLVAYTFAFMQPLRKWVRGLILALAPLTAVGCQILGTLVVAFAFKWLRVDRDRLFALAGWANLLVVFAMFACLMKLLTWAALPVRYYTMARGR